MLRALASIRVPQLRSTSAANSTAWQLLQLHCFCGKHSTLALSAIDPHPITVDTPQITQISSLHGGKTTHGRTLLFTCPQLIHPQVCLVARALSGKQARSCSHRPLTLQRSSGLNEEARDCLTAYCTASSESERLSYFSRQAQKSKPSLKTLHSLRAASS